jgi:hypothetical protein
MSIAAGAVSLVGLAAQAAEPVQLSDAQLEQVTAEKLPDIIIWDITGDEGPGGPAG